MSAYECVCVLRYVDMCAYKCVCVSISICWVCFMHAHKYVFISTSTCMNLIVGTSVCMCMNVFLYDWLYVHSQKRKFTYTICRVLVVCLHLRVCPRIYTYILAIHNARGVEIGHDKQGGKGKDRERRPIKKCWKGKWGDILCKRTITNPKNAEKMKAEYCVIKNSRYLKH